MKSDNSGDSCRYVHRYIYVYLCVCIATTATRDDCCDTHAISFVDSHIHARLGCLEWWNCNQRAMNEHESVARAFYVCACSNPNVLFLSLSLLACSSISLCGSRCSTTSTSMLCSTRHSSQSFGSTITQKRAPVAAAVAGAESSSCTQCHCCCTL